MASPCPCGCGRKIAHSRQVAAAGLVEMDAALTAIRDAIDVLLGTSARPDVPRDFRSQSERFLRSGEDLRRDFLAHAHGSASPVVTPDLVELRGRTNEWLGAGTVLMQSARSHRPVQR